MDKETPITKYLATLERRQAMRERDVLFGSSSSGGVVSPQSPRNMFNIRQQLRFEDETFLQAANDLDQSVIPCSPPTPATQQQVHQPSSALTSSSYLRPLLPSSTTNGITRNPLLLGLTSSSSGGGGNRRDPQSSASSTASSGCYKRKRYSFEDKGGEEDHIKKICELQKLLRQTNGDLVEARATTAKLEKQKMDLRTESYEKSLQYEKSMSEMRIKCRDAVEKAESLEKDRELKNTKLEELTDELRRQGSSQTEKLLNLEAKVASLERENAELRQKVVDDNVNQTESVKTLSESLQESEQGSGKWSMECQMLKEQIGLKDAQIAKYLEELKESQNKIFRLNELTQKYAQPEGSESQILALQEDVKKYENLYVKEQTENAKISQQLTKLSEESGYLKGCMKKELLLEEQIASLETEVKYLRSVAKNKAEAELERDSLKEKLQQWMSVAQKIGTQFTNAQNFAVFLGSMQSELVQMKHENATLNCRIDSLNRDIAKMQSETATARGNERLKAEECEKILSEVKQLSRRLTLVTKDRDGMKTLKESYEQELEGIITPALKERVIQLEDLVKEYEQTIEENYGSPALSNNCRECDKRIALISQLRLELEKAYNKDSTRDMSAFGDTTNISDSDGNTTGIKIVTFANNPSALSLEARVKELCSENGKLKERIKYLENQSLAGPSDTIVAQGNQMLEEQIRNLERKHQILSEAYDYETQQLQTALSKLFGFHVILVREPHSQFRLQSVYGSGPEDELIFQEAENSDMMLLESPVLDHFRDDIDRFLLREGSIPAFLSTVTIAFSQGLVQPSDTSQPQSSQQSSSAGVDTVTVYPDQQQGRNIVEVEVQGRGGRATVDEDDDDESVEEEEMYDDEDDDGGEEEEEQMEEEDDDEEQHYRENDDNESEGEVVYVSD